MWLCPVFKFSSVTWHYVQSKRSKTIAFVRSLYGRRNRKTPPSLIGERRHSHCKKTLTLGFHGIVLHCWIGSLCCDDVALCLSQPLHCGIRFASWDVMCWDWWDPYRELKLFVFVFPVCVCVSCQGWPQSLCLLCVRVAESRRRGRVLWDRRCVGAEGFDESVQRRPLHIASGQTQTLLHPGVCVCRVIGLRCTPCILYCIVQGWDFSPL